ncbi:trypsin-like serine peptidase [Streptomyces sp. NPDC002886]|uniref:trypsin-like serine peptidase n=1 Tax=Streptomyces sp. NPDC002886 TaxID=3364667 RepID=UPI0036C736F8
MPDDPGGAAAARWAADKIQISKSYAAIATNDPTRANNKSDVDRRRRRRNANDPSDEAQIGPDDSLWVTFLSRGLAASRAVGRVVHKEPGEVAFAYGSGVLVSPRLFLTCNHVTPNHFPPSQGVAEFDYEHSDDGEPKPFTSVPFDRRKFWLTDEELDFSLVALKDLDGAPPGEKQGWVRLIGQKGKVLNGEAVNVIHHPDGDRKRVSIRENWVVSRKDVQWLRYTSDTRNGSSGSPVFNDQWEMVALHRRGFAAMQGDKYLTRTGEIWTADMGEEAIHYTANEGLRVSCIVKRLKEAMAGLGPDMRALLDEALKKNHGGNS